MAHYFSPDLWGGEPDPIELAWAAGLFDGEGSAIIASSPGEPPRPRLQIGQSGQEARAPMVLSRFHAAVGMLGLIHGPNIYDGYKQWRWVWQTSRVAHAVAVAEMILPYVCDVKHEQISNVLDVWRSAPRRRYTAQPVNPVWNTNTPQEAQS